MITNKNIRNLIRWVSLSSGVFILMFWVLYAIITKNHLFLWIGSISVFIFCYCLYEFLNLSNERRRHRINRYPVSVENGTIIYSVVEYYGWKSKFVTIVMKLLYQCKRLRNIKKWFNDLMTFDIDIGESVYYYYGSENVKADIFDEEDWDEKDYETLENKLRSEIYIPMRDYDIRYRGRHNYNHNYVME